MRRGALSQFVAYASVGAIGTAVQYSALFVLVRTGTFQAVAASCVGAVAGALVNYTLNYHVTFRSSEPHRTIAPRFFFIAVSGISTNSLLMSLLVHGLHMPWPTAQCATTICVLVVTYTTNSLWAFQTRQP
jgi:putative flippase GtrA